MRHVESSRLKSQSQPRRRVASKLINPHDRIQVLKFSARMVPKTDSNDAKAFGKNPLAVLDFFSYSKQDPNGPCALSDSDILPGLCIDVLFSKLLLKSTIFIRSSFSIFIATSYYEINVLCLFNSCSFLLSVLSFHWSWIFLKGRFQPEKQGRSGNISA